MAATIVVAELALLGATEGSFLGGGFTGGRV